MNILLFGESCTGKSALATKLNDIQPFNIVTGKDYLRYSKNKNEALKILLDKLSTDDENMIYVCTELEEVKLVPNNVLKVLVKAQLQTIKERFRKRMNGNLPKGVEIMLERKHGMFNSIPCDFIIEDVTDVNETELLEILKQTKKDA